MTVANRITGEVMQIITCQLGPDQALYADAGKFLWKTPNVSLETRLAGPPGQAPEPAAGAAGLLRGALATAAQVGKRALAGETLAFQWFRAAGQSGLVAFSGAAPGQIRVLELDGTGGWYAEAGSFVCAESTVDFDIAFQGWATAHRARAGFVLEHLTGAGTVVIAGAGSFLELNPAKYGGKIQVHAGSVVAFQDRLTFGVERVGGLSAQTAMTAVFGGEGINLATLAGDGLVVLQSFTYEGLADALHRHSSNRDEPAAGPGGILGRR